MTSYHQLQLELHCENFSLGYLRAKLSVNDAKYCFDASSHEFLGMIIDCTGIRPLRPKLEAASKTPRPKTVGELRSFLALTGYLRQFVQGHSIVVAP